MTHQAPPDYVPHEPANQTNHHGPLQLTDDRPRRPHSIDLALGLMVATAALGVISAVVTFVTLRHFNASYPAAVAVISASDDVIRQVQAVVQASLAVLGGVALIITTVLAVLASAVARGNRGARMGAWVLSAIGAAYGIASLLLMMVAHSTAPVASSDPAAAGAVQIAQDSIPGWFPGVSGLLGLVQALGFIASAILLAAPSSGPFFQRVMRPWRPEI